MIRVLFVMEQHVGHKAWYQNIRRYFDGCSDIEATWAEVTYSTESRLWSRLPGPLRHLAGTWIGRAEVKASLRRHRYDVAFFNTQVPAAIAGNAVHRVPYVISTDMTPVQYDAMGAYYGHRPDTPFSPMAWFKHRVNTRIFQNAAAVLPWSNWTARSLIHEYGVPAERIEVVPPGVDTAVWRPRAAENGSGPRPMRILFVGGHFERKGGDVLLQAFRRLPRGTAELVLVTREAVPPAEGVSVHRDMKPNTPALITLCQSCDVFVLPTRAEAFGIAAVEASALGMPVIVTATGGLTDVVADGESGFVIPPDDTTALADRLEYLAHNPDARRQMGRTGRARAETCFDVRKNAQRIQTVLEQTAALNSS